MKICVFGLWHLGSVTSAGLAKRGNTVTGLDFETRVIEDLRRGEAPVFEPGLNDVIREHLQKNLAFTDDPKSALRGTDIIWITFDTPVDEEDVANVTSIREKFEKIVPHIENGMKIIVSSQIPVGFTRSLQAQFTLKNPGKTVYFAYSPENLRLGKSLKTFLEPDRIVIGTNPEEKELFLPVFSTISNRLEWMSIESAEMTKHAINAFLATSICYANEVATLCEFAGANAKEVERGLKTEERIGPKAYLNPGNAFSGGTLARDVRFLQNMGKENYLPMHLLNSVLQSNDFHKNWIRRKCIETMGNLKGKCVTVLGLTYKPDTNTLRRSLSIELCKWLHDQGARVTAFDPAIKELPEEYKSVISLASGLAPSIEAADVIIIATEWPEFNTSDDKIISALQGKIIIDPNGFIERIIQDRRNSRYFAVGRSYP
jgi:UDPglucose 6-dehydrogenase